MDFHCPTCETPRPPYGFHMNGADLGVMGVTQYMTVFCSAQVKLTTERCARCSHFKSMHTLGQGACLPPDPRTPCDCTEFAEMPAVSRACGAILSVAIIGWAPPQDPALLAQFHAALKGSSPV